MHNRLKSLVSLPFIVCLILLLVNDFFLKAAFHNVLTGKLSDCCGLFIFPIFWAALFPKRKLWIFILTGILFIYWKSEYAAAFIEFFSTYFFTINRVVDPSDLVALPFLLLAWLSLKADWGAIKATPILRQAGSFFIAIVTFFSFCATSQLRYIQTFDQPQYLLFKSSLPPDSTTYSEDYKYYTFDSLLVVGVNELYGNGRPAKNDDYNKNLMVKHLYREVFNMLKGNKSFMNPGKVTSLTIKTKDGEDFARFKGGRLDGRFVRKKGNQVIIEGFYKLGFEDSVWTVKDTTDHTVTKTTFINGERTKVQRYDGNKLISSQSINTRAETKRNKCIQIGILALFTIGIAILIVKNYRNTNGDKLKIKLVWKWILCLVLPFSVWLVQLGMVLLLGDYNYDVFLMIGTIAFVYIATCPLFFIIIFWIKLSKEIDILWYCLLLALAASIWVEYDILVGLAS
jgi:hypothetical protein